MIQKLVSLVLLVSSISVHAFVAKQPAVAAASRQTQLFVSQPLPQDDDTPGEKVFGRPLDENTKALNIKIVYTIKEVVFGAIFAEQTMERSFARFWALETIARMPYFSYLTVLHFYETIGMWRRSDYLRIHFAETWNEQHHLLIMEELGGNQKWSDRFIAQHMALGYFWLALLFYFVNPTFAYNFNQAIEEEAFETYANFLTAHKDFLKSQPAPIAAQDYYLGEDLYMFDALTRDMMPTNAQERPKMDTLYDCFSAIRDDEAEHAKTMIAMQAEGL